MSFNVRLDRITRLASAIALCLLTVACASLPEVRYLTHLCQMAQQS
jgi:hypothetical protein